MGEAATQWVETYIRPDIVIKMGHRPNKANTATEWVVETIGKSGTKTYVFNNVAKARQFMHEELFSEQTGKIFIDDGLRT